VSWSPSGSTAPYACGTPTAGGSARSSWPATPWPYSLPAVGEPDPGDRHPGKRLLLEVEDGGWLPEVQELDTPAARLLHEHLLPRLRAAVSQAEGLKAVIEVEMIGTDPPSEVWYVTVDLGDVRMQREKPRRQQRQRHASAGDAGTTELFKIVSCRLPPTRPCRPGRSGGSRIISERLTMLTVLHGSWKRAVAIVLCVEIIRPTLPRMGRSF
jgi:hypothetical protein